jgi:hypothetical protein
MSASTHRLSPSVALFVAALVTGCVIPMPVGEGNESDEGSSGAADTQDVDPPPGDSSGGASGTVPGLTSTGGPDPSSTDAPVDPSDESGGVFIMGTDGGIIEPCDPWTQDCPPGEKCTPSTMEDDGNAWDWARCSPIAADPGAHGEPCTVEGSPTSGIDTCELGAMCWDVDPDTGEGTCVALCTPPEDDPTCAPEGTVCAIANDAWLILCLPSCDPMLQDCEPGDACVPIGDVFACAPAGENPGGAGEPCEDIAICDPGLFCASSQAVPDCQGSGCCTPLCDITDPAPPCLPGQSCEPFYEPGTAPEGLENVGVCMLPA